MSVEAVLTFTDGEGYRLKSTQGAALYGPTWSLTLLGRWARENRVEIVREEKRGDDV